MQRNVLIWLISTSAVLLLMLAPAATTLGQDDGSGSDSTGTVTGETSSDQSDTDSSPAPADTPTPNPTQRVVGSSVVFAGYLIPIGDAGIDSEGAKAYRAAFIKDMLRDVSDSAPAQSSPDLDSLTHSWLVHQFDDLGAAKPDFSLYPETDVSKRSPPGVHGGLGTSVWSLEQDEQDFLNDQLYSNVGFQSGHPPAAYGVSVGVGFYKHEPTFWIAWAWRAP